MTLNLVLTRVALVAAVSLALTLPSLAAGKWALVGGIVRWVDDLAVAGKSLDGGINDAANASRQLDDAAESIGRGLDDVGDAGGLAARAPVVYDRVLPKDLLDDAAYAAAEANKKIPNIVRQGDEVGGAPKSIDTAGYTSAKSPSPLPNFKSAYEPPDAPFGSVRPPADLKLVSPIRLPDPSKLALAKNLPDVPAPRNVVKAIGDGGLPKAARAAGSDPAKPVAAAKNGSGWSTRKKVILATGVTTGLLVTGGTAAAALAYSTYEPAKEALEDAADQATDLVKKPAILTVNNYTEDRVEIFEVLFDTRKSLRTLEASGDFASISASVGDKIAITRNGEPFTEFILQQDELIYVQ